MSISETHKTWLYDVYEWRFSEGRFQSLLSLTSHSDEGGGEPRWLVFCDYLAKAMVNRSADQGAGEIERQLHAWAIQLWGPNPLSREELAWEWFGEQGPNEIIDRAFAVASLVGQHHDNSLPPLFPNALSEQLLSAPERAALIEYLVERHGPRDQVRVPVMLVNDSAPPGEQGRRSQLRLTPIRVPADQHGQLFRAPAALLLSLRKGDSTSFEDGLRKVERLLAACLKPPQAEQGWGLLWSLHPEPMALDHQDVQKPYDWFMHSITGASATGAFELAGLWVLREQLDETLEGMTLARQQLRDIHPAQFAISAQLEGDAPPDPRRPLGWRWDRVGGLDEKLGSFVRDQQLMRDSRARVSLVLVSDNQAYAADDLIEPEPVQTVADAIDMAYKKVGAPLPPAGERLRRYLLNIPLERATDDQGQVIEEARPKTPLAPLELIEPLRPETQRSNPQALDGPSRPEDVGKPNAIAWYLLHCYARWAGGDHILWGEPARLAEDFFPIRLETDAVDAKPGEVALKRSETGTQKLQARSLIQLLDTAFLEKQPPLWLLSASPAAGKTTMMAEYQLHHAYKALHQYALSGHFGVVPVWIPARQLDPDILDKGTLDQAINAWLQDNWPALGSLRDLLNQTHARVQVLLDGVNELNCQADSRSKLLADWLSTHFGPNHHHLPPLLTVRSLELVRLKGAWVAQLLPWDEGQRENYVKQRLGDQPEYLEAMQVALAADKEASDEVTEKMLYSSPGLLSLACTLMRRGLLPPDPTQRPMNRARLLSTLIWSSLAAEGPVGLGNIPGAMLGPEETDRLRDLEGRLREGDWHPPQAPGPLIAALAEQARHMQFDHAVAEIELPQRQWWCGAEGEAPRQALTRAAGHLGVVQSRRVKDAAGRFGNWLSYRHQLLLEYFASLGLTPDGPWPANVVAPTMRPVSEDYEDWMARKKKFEDGVEEQGDLSEAELQKAVDQYQVLSERGDSGPGTYSVDGENVEVDAIRYRLPAAAISVHEEAIKLAAQLRGDPVDWVKRLMLEGNAPLAARLALENWSAFGEPVYPQEDCLNPWRKDKTHPVLNELRQNLHERMYDEAIHPAQRVEAGDLLGALGGSPLYEICGQALILKDELWMPIGSSGKTYHFEMGDLDGYMDERTAEGRLLQVNLPSFQMAGYLTTIAQYRCFVQCGDFKKTTWWPREVEALWYRNGEFESRLLRVQMTYASGQGLAPVEVNFWQAQAYAMWEQAQRERDKRSPGLRVHLPTEAQWEGAARWPRANQTEESGLLEGAPTTPTRWRFAHTEGVPGQRSTMVYEVGLASELPWSFNHNGIIGSRTNPVGVFLHSRAGHKKRSLHDLAGNVCEWCASAYRTDCDRALLGPQVEHLVSEDELRAIRGGSFNNSLEQCRVGYRYSGAPDGSFVDHVGFRLVLVAEL